jgi:hypothetical protein
MVSQPVVMLWNVDRPRHQKSDFEALLREAESRGWRVSRNKGYFKCYCGCAEKHHVRVVLTPSSSRTLLNTRKAFERARCWEGGNP